MNTTDTISPATTVNELETLAKSYATARETVAERVDALQEETRAIHRRRLPGIKLAVAAASDAQAKLIAAIEAHPQLFVRPRTLTLHGIRFGYAKGRGKTVWPEDAALLVALRKHFSPGTIKALIETVERPVKAAIELLPAPELKKLGVVITGTGDYVFVKASDTEVDKLVAKILEEGAIAEPGGGS